MCVTLETLDLTPEELKSDRDTVHRMAYLRWLDAGRPDKLDLDFWLEAEREWVQRRYVPHRVIEDADAN